MHADSHAHAQGSDQNSNDAVNGPTSATVERRRYPRAVFPARLLLTWPDHDLEPVTCLVRDASLTGFRLVSDKSVVVGSTLHAWRILPEGTRIHLDMQVVWVKPARDHCSEFGVRYLDH